MENLNKMNTSKISKLYVFNLYVSIISLILIFVRFQITNYPDRNDFFYPDVEQVGHLFMTFPFVNLMINLFSVKKKPFFWNILFIVVNFGIFIDTAYNSGLFPSGGKSKILFGIILIIFLGIPQMFSNFALPQALIIIYMTSIIYFLIKDKLKSILFVRFGEFLYIFLLVINIYYVWLFKGLR